MQLKILILFVFVCRLAGAQTYIESMKLEVAANKTTNLVFPSNIVTVDRGNETIVVQKSAPNILRVKANNPFTEETNLTVVTSDGKLYSFLVSYHATPAHLNINLGNFHTVKTDTSLAIACERILKTRANLYGLKFVSGGVSIELNGFYVNEDILFCKFKIENRSQISFYIDQYRLHLSDGKPIKRSASQDLEIKPLFILGDTAVIKGKSSATLVMAISSFTIPAGKNLFIEVPEKNGGRNLLLKVKGRYIINAKLFENN